MPQIPVSLGLWIASLVPLAVILYLLVGLRWKAATAAPVGYFLAVLVAFLIFQANGVNVAVQTVKGVWNAVFIIYVILPALLLYEVSEEAGAFNSLRQGIEAYTPNDLLHVLAFGWVFSSFLQGITGFGAPVAVVAPLLVIMGVRPLWAVIIPLLGHPWANTFGTLAVAWEGLGLVTTMDDPALTATISAIMLLLANLVGGLAISWLYGKGKGVREGLPLVLIVAAIHGVGQLLLAPVLPTIAVFVPATIAVAVTLGLARTPWYRDRSKVTDSPIMKEGEQESDEKSQPGAAQQDQERASAKDKSSEETGEKSEPQPGKKDMPLWLAFSPYIVLIALIVIVLLIPPVNDALGSFRVGLPFPEVTTDLGMVIEQEESYSAFAPLTHPGTFLLLSAVAAFLVFRVQGYIRAGRMDEILVDTIRTTIPSAMALFALVPLAKVMEGSGQVLELAMGIAAVASAPVYAFLSPFIGGLGAFMTSSNLSSNILFGSLQESTAAALSMNEAITLAGQTAGGAVGNSIAPGNVLLGLSAVGSSESVGDVIRRTIIYMLGVSALVGIIAVIAVFVL